MYLQQVSNLTEKEILKMPYPKFREYISFYTDPKGFTKRRSTQTSREAQLSELDRIKKLKATLEGR